uniref:Uncharacterized protein n=1 Tax=Serinus canaria TaxID=9135 RepID=A0A8C9NI43_SERCA
IIQSSQPSSLKFTCRGFLLQRVFAFFPWPLPPERAAMVVLLFLRLRYASWPGSGGSRNGGLPRALILSRISLKRFSFLCVREKATSRAFQTSNTSHLEEPASRIPGPPLTPSCPAAPRTLSRTASSASSAILDTDYVRNPIAAPASRSAPRSSPPANPFTGARHKPFAVPIVSPPNRTLTHNPTRSPVLAPTATLSFAHGFVPVKQAGCAAPIP